MLYVSEAAAWASMPAAAAMFNPATQPYASSLPRSQQFLENDQVKRGEPLPSSRLKCSRQTKLNSLFGSKQSLRVGRIDFVNGNGHV